MASTAYESEITTSSPAVSSFSYAGASQVTAAIATVDSAPLGDVDYDAVFLAFPFADLTTASRINLLERLMTWLSPPLPLAGDANGDGQVTATDALVVLRAAVGTAVCSLCACDVSADSAVTATDALMVLRRAVGQPVVLDPPPC
jgi:hypothetical protein